jgi:hypothetical protein
MNRILINAGMVLAITVLSGCASMSSEECVNSDWAAIGYEDGSRGYTTDKFGSRRKACAKHGVTADFKAYQEGRDEGLVEFCQPSRGYNLGASGGTYYGVCDVAMEEEFLDAYRVGAELHTLRSNVNNANSRIYSKEAELKRTKEKIRAKEAELISDDVTTQDRVLFVRAVGRAGGGNRGAGRRQSSLRVRTAGLPTDRRGVRLLMRRPRLPSTRLTRRDDPRPCAVRR